MSTLDRCTCYQELTRHVGDSFARFRITEKDESCPEHGEVEQILATGRYTDKQGREWWTHSEWHWIYIKDEKPQGELFYVMLTVPEMRLLIERDQHRSTCPGLWECRDHPVPTVTISRLFRPRIYVNDLGTKRTLSEAIDDARALAALNV